MGNFLRKYQEIQQGISIDELIGLDFAQVSISNDCVGYDYNYSQLNRSLDWKELKNAEKEMYNRGLRLILHFEDSKKFKQFEKKIVKKGYKLKGKRSWFFWPEKKVGIRFSEVEKAENSKELKKHLELMEECFEGLGTTRMILEKAWKRNRANNKLYFFTFFENDKPVAVSNLTSFKGLGYISNIGSLPKVRGKGFGKAATLYAVKKSIELGNKEHFLATDANDSFLVEFYKRLGFEHRFNTVFYVKGEVDPTKLKKTQLDSYRRMMENNPPSPKASARQGKKKNN